MQTLTDIKPETHDKIFDLLDQVNKSDISSIKQTVTLILNTVNDPNSSARELKHIIEIDPPLTAKLLKLANSVLYGYPKTICEIQEAIVCIGFEAVRELALSQKVCELFQKSNVINGYSRLMLWKHSVAVAMTSKMLYRRELCKKGEDAYVAGLLHDLGLIVIDQFLHDDFKQILGRALSEKNNLFEIEKEVLGFTHYDIGMALAENWGFPDEIVIAIGNHHNPNSVGNNFSVMASALYIADSVIQASRIGFSDSKYKDEVLFEENMKKLNIKEKALEFILDDVTKEIDRLEQAEWFQ